MESLTVVVPTYNGEERLPKLLDGLRAQDYDQSLIELIVVDDDSTDATREVAERYGARVLRNGFRHGDIGRTIGVDAASNDLLMLLDDDNHLTHNGWLRNIVDAYLAVPNAAGAQCVWFDYRKEDGAFDRFSELFGQRDPLIYYLGRQDHLRYTDKKWPFVGTILAEDDRSWTIRFRPEELPTVGSQGFLTRKSLLDKVSDGWHPLFLHIDINYDLTKIGYTDFVMVKDRVGHDSGATFWDYLKSTSNSTVNMARTQQKRTYKYETNPFRIAWAFIKMLTFIDPIVQGVRMYTATRDRAALLHPVVSFGMAVMHLIVFPREKVRIFIESLRGRTPGKLST